MYFVCLMYFIYINYIYIYTHTRIYVCVHIYTMCTYIPCVHIYHVYTIYQWWIAEQRQYCIEPVTESWVLKAETRSALSASPEMHCSPFSLEPRSLLSSWETGKSPKLIPAELRRLNRDLCPLGLNLKSKRNQIVLSYSPVLLELKYEPVVPTGSMFCRETPK